VHGALTYGQSLGAGAVEVVVKGDPFHHSVASPSWTLGVGDCGTGHSHRLSELSAREGARAGIRS
jgi:hypothetical protein